jgi:hypothetical protein
MTRGPIHEAYAEPVDTRPPPTPVIQKQPPDPVDEVPSDQKPDGENVQWIPGYWAWDDGQNDYLWVSGFWRVPPPDRQWMPGHWDQVEGGYQWTPGFWTTTEQQEITYLPPPPVSVDARPSIPAPTADSTYVPGVWIYRDARYFWRPGFWLALRPGWVWVPAHYVFTPAGYVFVDGYWDYTLADRGLLFAPVFLDRTLRSRPRWFFQPRFAVYPDFILTALFVRRGWNCYYFGDFFEQTYVRAGFRPWIDVRIGGSSYDPLFSYYRWREGRTWDQDLRTLYVARFQGQAPRPPRTLAQQTTLIQNINNKTVTINNIRNVTVVAPVNKFESKNIKLVRVSEAQRQEVRKTAQQLRQVSQERAKVQAELIAKGVPTKPTDKPRIAKIELPKATAPAKPREGHKAPPPLPTTPKHDEKQLPRHEPPPKPEVRTEHRSEEKPATKPPAKPESKPPAKPEPKPEAKSPAKPEPKSEPKPAPKPEEKPAPKPSPKPEQKSKDKG